MKDFSLKIYRELLLALQQAGYAFYTFEDWCDGKAEGRYAILRHDVDLRADYSLNTAQIEAELGVRATYYFRVVPQSNQPEIIRAIANLGHEIGYHYEDLSLFKGDERKSIEHFELQLTYFRQFYPVRTICMHGSPTSTWDNRDLWKKYNYRDYGVVGEPYLDFLSPSTSSGAGGEVLYFTDTARMWDGDKYNVRDKISTKSEPLSSKNVATSFPRQIITSTQLHIHSTTNFISWLKTVPANNMIMITTHPQRWTNNTVQWLAELIIQNLKNIIKRLLICFS